MEFAFVCFHALEVMVSMYVHGFGAAASTGTTVKGDSEFSFESNCEEVGGDATGPWGEWEGGQCG